MLNCIWILFENQCSSFFVCFSLFYSLHFATVRLVSRKMTSEKRAQELQTDNASLPRFGSASDWSCRVENFLQPIRSTTQIWIVTRHQYGISAFVSQWWRREMWAVFSGLFCCCFVSFVIFEKRPCFNVQQTFLISERLEEEIITRLKICIRCG